MGKETISSQELSEYTHVNSTQIRRDLSGFGKFGKRGVGYNVDSLVSQIRKILRTSGQHNIALFGAGHLGQAIASSDIFADHGFRVVAIFDTDAGKLGQTGRRRAVRHPDELKQIVEDEDIVVGVLAVPTAAAQALADQLVDAGVKIIFNYSEALLQVPAGGDGAHVQPRRRPALRAVLLPARRLPTPHDRRRRRARDLRGLRPTSPSASRRSSPSSTPRRCELVPRFEQLRDAGRRRPAAADAIAGELISVGDRDPLGRAARDFEDARAPPARGAPAAVRARARARRRARRRPARTRFSDYRDQHIIDTEHYHRVEDGLKYVAWRNNTFSVHVHVGVRGADRAVRVCDRLRPVLPLLLAISANSPYVDGHRLRPALRPHADLHQVVPALRHPGRVRRWQAWADYVDLLVRTSSIVEFTQLWWSVRPHHDFGTVEVRICDAQTTGAGGRRAGRADRRLRRRAAARGRRGGDPARPARPPDRGEHVARDPLRARRPPARPRGADRSRSSPPPRRSTA